MKQNNNSIILLLNYLVGVFLISMTPSFLPEQYFSDGETIKAFIPDAVFKIGLDSFDSYANTAFFYKILGLGSVLPDWIAAFISYTIPFLLIVVVLKKLKLQMNFITAALFSVWNILLAVYFGMYSKEPLALSFVTLILLLAGSNRGMVLGLFFALIYAVFFRIYWLIAIGFFAVNLFLIRRKYSFAAIIFIQLAIALAVFKLANVVTGQYLSEFRSMVNEREVYIEVATMVNNVLPNSSSIHDWLNAIIGWGMLLFPLYLIRTGAMQHIVFMFFQLANLAFFVAAARFLVKNMPAVEYSLGGKIRRRLDVSIAWCLAYSFVQGIFEPDFGSFSRHQVILLPMWLWVMVTYYQMKEQNKTSWSWPAAMGAKPS
jgi:hypothetical protein